jgi:hypothetical protein
MENKTKNKNAPTTGLRWDDPAKVRRWFRRLRAHILDALAAGEDATAPFSERVLSRAEARRKLAEAEDCIEALLADAELGLGIDSDQTPEEPS